MKAQAKWILSGVAFTLGISGAILAFALHPGDTSAGPFDLQAIGGVMLGAAVLLAAAIAIAAGVQASTSDSNPRRGETNGNPERGNGNGLALDGESLRTITGLVAVVTAIVAVGALTVVAINLLGGEEGKESTVAITTSAFGIVSAVVSAYLGIKATVNASDKASKAIVTALGNQGEPDGGDGGEDGEKGMGAPRPPQGTVR